MTAGADGGSVWDLAWRGLDGLPGGAGLNLAHEALDRHVQHGNGDVVALRCVAPGSEAVASRPT